MCVCVKDQKGSIWSEDDKIKRAGLPVNISYVVSITTQNISNSLYVALNLAMSPHDVQQMSACIYSPEVHSLRTCRLVTSILYTLDSPVLLINDVIRDKRGQSF